MRPCTLHPRISFTQVFEALRCSHICLRPYTTDMYARGLPLLMHTSICIPQYAYLNMHTSICIPQYPYLNIHTTISGLTLLVYLSPWKSGLRVSLRFFLNFSFSTAAGGSTGLIDVDALALSIVCPYPSQSAEVQITEVCSLRPHTGVA
jgi:hypothetical protein